MNLKALLILITGHLVTDISTGALPAFLPFIKESLHLSYTATASIILIFSLTSSVIQPIFGYFSDRWSANWLLPAGCLIASLGMGLLGFATSYAWIFFFAGLSGLGQGGFHPEGFKIANFIGGEKKASAISLFLVGGSLGLSVGPLMATLFFKYLGLKGSILFFPLGILMAAIFMVTPSWRVKTEHFEHKGRGLIISDSLREKFFPMALLVLVVVLRSVTQLSLQTFIPFYFINILHRDPLVVGKYLTTFLLTGAVGSLVGGPLADRYGYKRTVLFSLSLTPIFLYLFFYTDGTESLFFFAMAGIVLNAPHATNMAMGQAYMPQNLGMASGLILGLAMGIGGIGTTILGSVADHWSLYATLNITFVLPLLGFLLFSFIPYPPQKSKRVQK